MQRRDWRRWGALDVGRAQQRVLTGCLAASGTSPGLVVFGGTEIVGRPSFCSGTCIGCLPPGLRGSRPRRGWVLRGCWALPGAWWAGAVPSLGRTLVRSGISCLVSLRKSLSIQTLSRTQQLNLLCIARRYSAISVSCSGSRGLPRRCACGRSGSALPEPRTGRHHLKTAASVRGSCRVQLCKSFKAPALFGCSISTLCQKLFCFVFLFAF